MHENFGVCFQSYTPLHSPGHDHAGSRYDQARKVPCTLRLGMMKAFQYSNKVDYVVQFFDSAF